MSECEGCNQPIEVELELVAAPASEPDGDVTIDWFRGEFGACLESLEWTRANCQTMQDVWRLVPPEWLVWVATRPGVLDPVTAYAYVIHAARRAGFYFSDDASRLAFAEAEWYLEILQRQPGAVPKRSFFGASLIEATRLATKWATDQLVRDYTWPSVLKADAARLVQFCVELPEPKTPLWSSHFCFVLDAMTRLYNREQAVNLLTYWLRENAKPRFSRSILNPGGRL